MLKYEMITTLKEGTSEYVLVEMAESMELNPLVLKHLKEIKSIIGIRVIDTDNDSHINYWFGRKMDLSMAVERYWLPSEVAMIFADNGYEDVLLLKDGHFQTIDVTNLPMANIPLYKPCVKRSRKKVL